MGGGINFASYIMSSIHRSITNIYRITQGYSGHPVLPMDILSMIRREGSSSKNGALDLIQTLETCTGMLS